MEQSIQSWLFKTTSVVTCHHPDGGASDDASFLQLNEKFIRVHFRITLVVTSQEQLSYILPTLNLNKVYFYRPLKRYRRLQQETLYSEPISYYPLDILNKVSFYPLARMPFLTSSVINLDMDWI